LSRAVSAASDTLRPTQIAVMRSLLLAMRSRGFHKRTDVAENGGLPRGASLHWGCGIDRFALTLQSEYLLATPQERA
jgi:hypothetical protein